MIAPTATVGQVVAQHPALARTFESLRIDYCCGGTRSLEEVCRDRGLPVAQLLAQLDATAGSNAAAAETDWTQASLSALCDHIERTHHDYLRRELPRLSEIIAKVVKVHGQQHRELAQVEAAFHELRAELEPHMMKEERILFPAIRHLEAVGRVLHFPFGSLANPIRVMVGEHDNAGDALARLRALTGDFAVPRGACNTYRVMLDSLQRLEADMHLHVHKENNILFPRAVALERQLGDRKE